MKMYINKYNPLRGSGYIDIPAHIRNKHAIVNVKANDDDCFAWAIMSCLYRIETHSDRVSSYPSYEDVLNFSRITFPVTIRDGLKFEKLKDVSVNIFMLKVGEKVAPVHSTKDEKDRHVSLLYIADEHTSHYCWIKNLSRLVSSQCDKNNHKKFICNRCLHYFKTEDKLTSHKKDCREINDCHYRGKIS